MSTLHVITNANDRLPLQVIEQEGACASVLLLQDGVFLAVQSSSVWACIDDVRARGLESPHSLVDYEGIIDLIFSHDKVICWH